MRILIVQERLDVLATLYGLLESKGYVVDTARHGYAALALVIDQEYDLILLDVALTGLNGPETCARLRIELGMTTPVMMLSQDDTPADLVAAFDSGADDYLVSPFSPVELDVRLRALVRRTQRNQLSCQRLRFGELLLDIGIQEAFRARSRVDLTRTGYRLLHALMTCAPRVASRISLAHMLWGDAPPDSDALRTHIHVLRRAIDKPYAHALLRTVPGVGYRLALPDEHADWAEHPGACRGQSEERTEKRRPGFPSVLS